MKKLFKVIIAAGALATAATLTACTQNTADGGKLNNFTSAESVYAFSAASAGMIISGTPDQTAPDQTAPEQTAPEQTTPDTPATGQAVPDKYMALVDSLLSEGAFNITEGASDRAEYEWMTTVSYRDMSGNSHSYVMHYNKYDLNHDRHDDEEEYAISGVMVIEGVDYSIRGERETESERGESESETKFTVDLGEGKKMVVEQSYEREGNQTEQEYSYSVYAGGRLTERSTFKYENERNQTEIKMTTTLNGSTEAFYFSSEVIRGEQVMILRTGSGKDAVTYRVTPVEGENGTTYIYEPIVR